jgi:hypothetical protein
MTTQFFDERWQILADATRPFATLLHPALRNEVMRFVLLFGIASV